MKSSVRQILAGYHIADITIALLMLNFVDAALHALWQPMFSAASLVFEGLAVGSFPYLSPGLTLTGRLAFLTEALYLYTAIFSFLAAWGLSNWVHSTGPAQALSRFWSRVSERKNV